MRGAMHVLRSMVLCAGVLCGFASSGAALLTQSNVVGLPTVAPSAQYSFTVSGAAVVTLTDLATPAAFTALQMVVTSNDAVVGSPASIDPTTNTTTLAIPSAGTYMLYVVGLPNSTQGFGSYGVCVALKSATSTCIAQYSNTLATPSSASTTGTSTLQTSFTSTTAGTYTVTLTDDAFPIALSSVSAGVFQGSTPIAVDILPATPTQSPTQITLAAATTYDLLADAIANTSPQAGLYGIRITDPNGKAVFDSTFPVGALAAATVIDNPTAQSLTLDLTDYGYPATLASVGAVITSGGSLLGTLDAEGSAANIRAPVGSLDVWTYAAAGTQPGVYGISITGGSGTLLSTTQVVDPTGSSSSGEYAFVVNIAQAGTYQVTATDFQFPDAFKPLVVSVGQNGTTLAQDSSGDFTAESGIAIVIVNAVLQSSGGSGLFDVTVQSTGSSAQVLLDQTQAVGAVLNSQTVTVTDGGGYTVNLTDLAFPQAFSTLEAFISQGGQVVGRVDGGGMFQFQGTAGDQYLVTVLAVPSASAPTGSTSIVPGYGLYSFTIESSAPTLTLTSSASSVASGGSVTLTWTSENATSCTASGGTGWTGSQATSGTLAVTVTATETLALSCTGPGGSVSQSVSVTATAAASSKSGGGALDLASILALFGLWGLASTVNRVPVGRVRSGRR
jgi:hypothetical protein